MNDLLIRNALLVDGRGTPARPGGVAIRDGLIVEAGPEAGGSAHRVIDARGAVLAPAWVDIHTHYDGQATWDPAMLPSAGHGVGTVVMGNCGVGFAPVAEGGERDLIELMEGVEDIPGTALHEGMPWGAWTTYPQYLDFLATREYALDVGSMIAHGPVRNHAMGERGRTNQPARLEDLSAMATIVEQGLRAGALGFSSSRILAHRAIGGEPVPGTFADDDEVMALAGALRAAGRGVLQVIPSSTIGSAPRLGGERHTLREEVDLMARASRHAGRPLTFTLFQIDEWKDLWREVLDRVAHENARGARLYPQVGSRPTAIVMSLDTYHVFMRRAAYLPLATLPLAERARRMRDPDVRAAILTGPNVLHASPGRMDNVVAQMAIDYAQVFSHADFEAGEPTRDRSFAEQARRAGVDPQAFLYDYLVAGEGRNFAMRFFSNYSEWNHDAIHAMQSSELTVTGLSDAGAHVSVIFDAVAPTWQLTHWVRGRTRGPRLPLEQVVHRQTLRNAQLFGLDDRGAIEAGRRADLNLIDLDALRLGPLEVHRDLPAGGARLLQSAHGYLATFVNGVQTRDRDEDTGARPGRLVRGAAR